ncbi:MAG TPA: dienelactone hydrolase family protein [Acidimicrobiales bacterium]|jgi:carboxymethylenebutenolidase
MGETIEFPVNGTSARGYLALPPSGSGPGVMVVQEWWGLSPQLKGVTDRFAAEGFVALAPDLYHGELATHDEMDKASELMNKTVPSGQAATDMMGAIDHLLGLDATTGFDVGVVGFCMGGLLAMKIAALAGSKVGAAAPFYGAPIGDDTIDWSNLSAVVRGHFAELDDFFPPDACQALFDELKVMGHDVEITVHPGTHHAFVNEENAIGPYYDEAAATKALGATFDLFRSTLG